MQSSFNLENCVKLTAGLKITGSLGKVMKESVQIAYTFAKDFAH